MVYGMIITKAGKLTIYKERINFCYSFSRIKKTDAVCKKLIVARKAVAYLSSK